MALGRAPVAAALVLVFVAAGQAPSAAFHEPGIPLLSADPVDDNLWVAYLLTPSRGRASIEVVGDWENRTRAAWLLWFIRDGEADFHAALLGFSTVDVFLRAPLQVGVVADVRIPRSGGAGLGIDYRQLGSSPLILLVSVATEGAFAGEVRAYGGALLNKTLEPSTFLFHERDFGGIANARAAVGFVGPQALVDGSVAHEVESSLFGLYWADQFCPVCLGGTERVVANVGYDGPEGTRAGSTFYVIPGEPPGAYRFWAEPYVEPVFGSLVATGADVALPT